MVIDSSAIMASLSAEPDADRFRRAPTAASECRISVSNVFECRVVLGGRFSAAMLRNDTFFKPIVAAAPRAKATAAASKAARNRLVVLPFMMSSPGYSKSENSSDSFSSLPMIG